MSDRTRHELSRTDFAAYFASEARLHWTIAAGHAGRDLADDVVQDAAMIALSKLSTFTVGTNLRAWFAQIVTNVARNQRRKRAKNAAEPLEGLAAPQLDGHVPVDAHGSLRADQVAFDDQVLEALEGLAPDARAVLLLRVVHELPYGEIARTLQMPENTAMSHVHRAREFLRTKLAPTHCSKVTR